MATIATDLATYWVHIALVLAVAMVIDLVVHLSPGRARLVYWRFVVAVCWLGPLLPAIRPLNDGPRYLTSTVVATLRVAVMRTTDLLSVRALGGAVRLLLFGMVMRLVWLAAGLVRLRGLRRTSTPAALGGDLDRLHAAIAPRASIRLHPRIEQPVTFGWYRPVVLLPRSLRDLPLDEQCAVVCHELVHVARADWLWMWLEEGVRTAFWFHPPMRWAIGQMQLGREETVDARVVRITGARRPYMAALLRFTDRRDAFALAMPFMRRRHVVWRMRALSQGGAAMSRTRIAVTSAALAIVMTGTAWTVLGAPALQRGERVYTPGHGVSLPAATREVHPFYTPGAMAARIAGTVEMGCVVRPDGTVSDVTIARSLDAVHGLDVQAVKALKQWRFTPGMKDGRPVAVRVMVEMTFTLK